MSHPLSLIALIGVAWFGYDRIARRHRERLAAPAEPLQRWEGEGGGVPVDEHRTAAQVQPRPLPEDDGLAAFGSDPGSDPSRPMSAP